jgi:hypothetical protein
VPGDQGADEFHDGQRIPGIYLELLTHPGNGSMEWISGGRRMKAHFVAPEFDGGSSRTGPELKLSDVIDRDLNSTGVKAKFAAGIHDQNAVSRKRTAHECFARGRFGAVEEAYTADEVCIALTGVLRFCRPGHPPEFRGFIKSPPGHMMFQLALLAYMQNRERCRKYWAWAQGSIAVAGHAAGLKSSSLVMLRSPAGRWISSSSSAASQGRRRQHAGVVEVEGGPGRRRGMGWMAGTAIGQTPETCPSCPCKPILSFLDDQGPTMFLAPREWFSTGVLG